MNKNPYANKSEILQMVMISQFAASLKIMADDTKDKTWHKKLKCCQTYLSKMLHERFMCLDKDQLSSIIRRSDHTVIRVLTSDQKKLDPNMNEISDKTVTLDIDDYFDLLDLASRSCYMCTQKEHVKECHWRKMFHKYGVPVARDNPLDGECEFRWNNELGMFEPHTGQQLLERL